MKDKFKVVCKMYEYFFIEVSGYNNFEFKPKGSQIKQIENFVKKKENEIATNWLYDFFSYQFGRYYDKKTRFGTGIVQLNWVIGDKALLKYKNRSEEELYYTNIFIKKFKLKNPLIKKEKLFLSDEYFNKIRKIKNIFRCFGLTLYDPKNKICTFCSNKLICKEL